MAIADYYKDSVTFYVRSYTRDAVGGRVETTTSRGATACRCEDVTGAEVEHLGVSRNAKVIRLYCTPTFTVYELDEARFTYNNQSFIMRVFDVDALYKKSTFHHYEILVTNEVNQTGHN